jgi:hypothetical protein
MLWIRRSQTGPQIRQPVPRVRRTRTRTTRHGNRELCQQGDDGQCTRQGQHRLRITPTANSSIIITPKRVPCTAICPFDWITKPLSMHSSMYMQIY